MNLVHQQIERAALSPSDALLARVFEADVSRADLIGARRSALMVIESMIAAAEQVPVPARHYFSEGLYAREITLPKGCAMSGGIHKRGHISVLIAGDVSILTEHGRERLKAPRIIISDPGVKRIGIAHEDTTWVTFHANPEDCTDPEVLWSALIAPTFEDLDRFLYDQGGF